MGIRGLGYLEVVSTRVEEWRRFATEVLGAAPASDAGDEVQRFAFDDVHHRLAVRGGDEEAISAIGWEYATVADLEEAERALVAHGIEIERPGSDECEGRRVGALVRFTDPAGFRHELFAGQRYRRGSFQSRVAAGGFVIGRRGFGHVVLSVPDVDACVALFRDVLGFRETEVVPIPQMRTSAVFLRCNPRHHSIAFIGGQESGLHHLMVQLNELDDVGMAYDRTEASGDRLMYTLGRHHGDGMLSFYVLSPSGFAIEYGWGAFDVNDDWVVRTPQPGEIWGHKRLVPGTSVPPELLGAGDALRAV